MRSVQEAIIILRRGRRDPRWTEAAEFLIERASPEVQLMLEVGRELERQAWQKQSSGRKGLLAAWSGKWQFYALVFLALAAVSGLGWALSSLVKGVCS
ncbi:hypothetical protein OLMES_1201 [Oleiphilus messinensis]|uniref:Uncharacterized protein n=1 Tax=Oleiphilus messinensis TaxID=141451 RepID=A0A1Y0I7B0_9GAMM|nr:hypothetical protein [Oleiphilus messinensis]ARU55283.1 hypothetical protein OLMES_1201 [Oleiphilus messinensis]